MITLSLEERSHTFLPGSTCSGKVLWELRFTPRRFEVTLLYHTEGKGSRDIAVVDRILCPNRSTGSEQFALQFPLLPYSFSGTLITLRWSVEAVAIGEETLHQRVDVTMSPSRAVIELPPGRPSGIRRGAGFIRPGG